jgi:hypothetical protein
MATLMERAIGAARLDAATYEEVEHDKTALGQAMTVVVVASVATGIGSAVAGEGAGFSGLVLGVLASLIGWFVWAGLTYLIGTKILPSPQTHADLGEMLRTIGFAASPGVLGILGVLPLIGGLVLFVTSIWQLATMVVAVRQALDYESTGRAIGVCLIGFVVYVLIGAVIVGSLIGAGMAVDGRHGVMAP